ncbi:MAG: RloB family protein [Methylococcaceae bacterium]|nr:RloB family protein [Methylococcaceae bacterium]
MALTSRKKRPLDRTVPHRRDTRLIIIAAEGRETEKQYFAQFRDTRVQVKVLATGEDNQSAPQHVIDRLTHFREEFQIGEGDELWLMVDVDRWSLAEITREAIQRGYQLAISNPCFEVWLLCHFQDPPQAASVCQPIEDALRAALGGSYNKSKLIVSQFVDKLESAMQRAKKLDVKPEDRWPQNVGSHAYKVVHSIRGLVS